MDIAEQEAQAQLSPMLTELICKISDEIIETAEEYEPIEPCGTCG